MSQRDYAPDYASIPPHGRWQHFDVGGRPRIDQLMASWPSTVDNQERTRRLLDLFLVSVLLDAGAGTKWQYKSKESGRIYRRSEGLAVASLEMFKAGEAHPASPSMMKYAGTELNKRRHELVMAAGGSDALEWDSEQSKNGKAPRDWLRTKGNSIEGGTSEIQLNIVAKHILGLPGA